MGESYIVRKGGAGGAGTIAPTINLVSLSAEEIQYTITNNEATSVELYYEMSDDTPELNYLELAGGETSSTITKGSLYAETSYSIFAKAQTSGKNTSENLEYAFTTPKYNVPTIILVGVNGAEATFYFYNNSSYTGNVYYEVDNQLPNTNYIATNGQDTSGQIILTLSPTTDYTLYARFEYNGSFSEVVSLDFATELVKGSETFTTVGTQSWTCPAGVTQVSVVCVGGGASGAFSSAVFGAYSSGGGGAGLGWKNNIAVTSGQQYTVVVGAGGASDTSSGTGGGKAGGNSYFIDTSTVVGYGGTYPNGGSYLGDGGGNGGYGGVYVSSGVTGGGGGAGGYSGNGGNGNTYTSGGSGSGGGAGAGGGGTSTGGFTYMYAGHGGNVGSYGEGASGVGGAVRTNGGDGSVITGAVYGGRGTGGNYSASSSGVRPTTAGGNGFVRIVWGSNRLYPSTNVGAD